MAGNTGLEPILPQSKCGVLPLHKFPVCCLSFQAAIPYWSPVIPPHGALRAILADFEALLSHQALFCVGQDVSCTYGNWRPTLARTLGNRTQHTGFWRPRRHLGTFARIYALPLFQTERRGVRATSYGRSLYYKGERMHIKPNPSLIICYQRLKVNSFLVQSLYIHQLLCRAPPTASALLTAPAHAARFHTNTATVLKLRRFSQVLPLNT